MRVVAFDTETHLIQTGCLVPRMVCLSAAEYDPPSLLWVASISPDRIVRELSQWQPKKGDPFPSWGRLRAEIYTRESGLAWVNGMLSDPEVILCGHNIWFDLGVCIAEDPSLLPLVFQALEDGRILDTMIQQQLLDIADGALKFFVDEDTGEIARSSYLLSDLSLRVLGRYLKKEDTWRLHFSYLDGMPLTEWPEEAVDYSLLDSIVTLDQMPSKTC